MIKTGKNICEGVQLKLELVSLISSTKIPKDERQHNKNPIEKNAKIETCDDDSDKISKYGRLDGETKHLLDSKLCRPYFCSSRQ